MYFRMIKNDIRKNTAITVSITLFVAAASMLVSLAAILAVNLAGAVDTLMEGSKTAHFMQMHSGNLDHEQLSRFASGQDAVAEFQVLEFLNIDGAQMVFPKTSLGDTMQDNGVSTQSTSFDYLLDLEGNTITPKDGELYIPICYMREDLAEIGDIATICGIEFTIAGFLRDSQMNSTLSSSKRFLVSKTDFEILQSRGSIEYLIEFRLNELSALGAFETAYTDAELPANGPTITYGLFKILNSFSDGMMVGVILLVSLLVVAVTLLCIRFTLLAKIEDETREIGVMKAIGLGVSDIRRVYLVKYTAIGIVGSALGYGLSLIFKEPLTQNIRLYMGESSNTWLALVLGIFGVMLVFFAILAYVNGVLGRLRTISAVEAIRFGRGQEKSAGGRRFCLSTNWVFSTNVFLGIKDILARKRLYATMLCVIVIAAFMMIVPQNLYNTISAKDFGRYMGIGNCDLRIDIQQTDHIEEKANQIKATMDEDLAVTKSVVLTTKIFKTDTDERLKVELGDHSVFPVAYSKGKAPVAPQDIALSAMNADEFAKQVGDSMTLYIDGKERQFMVCGVYSDITNGGKTAKAVFEDHTAEPMWSILCADTAEQSATALIVNDYMKQFPYAKIASIDNYIAQTFGQTVRSVQMASYAAIAIAVLITILVTLLFIKLLIAKDKASVAVMKSIGFTSVDIGLQYAVGAIVILLMGVLLGTLLANTLGETLGGMVISAFGASSFRFTINPVSAYLLCPLMLVCAVLIGAVFGTTGIENIKLSEHIKEG